MYVGNEPDGFAFKEENALLINHYNWYSYFFNPSTNRKWITDWMTKIDFLSDKISRIEQLPDKKFTNFYCATARILSRGNQLPDSCVIRLEQFILDNTKEVMVVEAPVEMSSSSEEVTNEVICAYDEVLDLFYDSKYNKIPEITVDLCTHKKSCIKKALQYYRALLDELTSTDDTILEAYRKLSTGQKRKYIGLVTSIVGFLGDMIEVERKPRKIKPKSPLKLVTKVKYKVSDTALKINSVPPQDIIGARSVWLYNIKYKNLTRLTSASGLSVKGTSIINYDTGTSVCKRLRKPEIVLKKVVETGKIGLRTLLDGIHTKSGIPNGRLNNDTLILRVLK